MIVESVNNAEKLEHMIDAYGDDVLRYAYLYLGDRGWAEDASQQVFLRVYQNMGDFRGEASIKTWILRITINTCKNIRKSKGYRKVLAECSLDALQSHTVFGNNLNPEDTDIWQEILKLPDAHRNVLVLKYYQDYTTEEIAKLLNLTQSAVRSRLSRAISKIRKNLEGRVDFYEPTVKNQLT